MATEKEAKKSGGETTTAEAGDFNSLLKKNFKPQTDRAREEVEAAVLTLAQQALSTTVKVSSDAVASIEPIIAEIDKKLSEQVNEIIHHQDFQQLEGSYGVGQEEGARTVDGAVHVALGGEVQHGVGRPFPEHPGHGARVGDVPVHEGQAGVLAQLREALEVPGVGELVEHEDPGLGLGQDPSHQVHPDEPRAAGHDPGLHQRPPRRVAAGKVPGTSISFSTLKKQMQVPGTFRICTSSMDGRKSGP